MPNTIDATVEFSFKGETYQLTSTLDLDAILPADGASPDVHFILAREHDIDTYSYLYDAMESHPVQYSNATGLATQCLAQARFDFNKYLALASEHKVAHEIQEIAHKHLHIDDLEQHSDIKNALVAAYHAGKHSAS
jgi:hypothetical protein